MLKYVLQNKSKTVVIDGRFVQTIDGTVAKVNRQFEKLWIEIIWRSCDELDRSGAGQKIETLNV